MRLVLFHWEQPIKQDILQFREAKHFYRFVRGGDDAMNAIRRETMFINILEGLHPLEAEIIVLVKDGKLEDRYKISKEVVATAYPDIVWGDA